MPEPRVDGRDRHDPGERRGDRRRPHDVRTTSSPTYSPSSSPTMVDTTGRTTPAARIRIPPELKAAAVAKAEGRTLTDLVLAALVRYVKTPPKTKP